MNFPTPQHLLHYATSASPTTTNFPDAAPQDLTDDQQWEKFDELFDKVFAPSKPSPESFARPSVASDQGHRKSKSLPGRFNDVDYASNSSSDVENFSDAWQDALRRTKKTVTTTTKRRIIRHTPPPPRLEMPASPPAAELAGASSRKRFPKTPYPQSDDEDGSTDGDAPNTPSPSPPRFLAHVRQASEQSTHGILGHSAPTSPTSVVRFKPPKVKATEEPVIWMTATFDMPEGLPKSDIHVGYSMEYGAEKATVSWRHVTIEEIVEGGKLVRERKERQYHRTLPLPRGTAFGSVKAILQDGILTIAYPSRPGAAPGVARPIEVLQLTR